MLLVAIIPVVILYRVTSNYKIARLRESLEPEPPANEVDDDDLGPEFESIDWESQPHPDESPATLSSREQP
jgi:hypothetical protein